MLESLFDKVAGLKVCNFIGKRFQRRCFPVKFAKFVRMGVAVKTFCLQIKSFGFYLKVFLNSLFYEGLIFF